MDNTLLVAGKRFEYIKTRDHVSVRVFKSEDTTQFLRIGNKKLIAKEVALHRNLIRYGFPVPPIISEGEYGREAYYIEQSLGKKHLSDLFLEDYRAPCDPVGGKDWETYQTPRMAYQTACKNTGIIHIRRIDYGCGRKI